MNNIVIVGIIFFEISKKYKLMDVNKWFGQRILQIKISKNYFSMGNFKI